jgi:hypothetical protein
MYFLTEGTNKIARGGKNIYDDVDSFKLIEIGQVVSVYDKDNLGRIKVRIKGPNSRGGDDNTTDADLPWAFPLIPKLVSIQPKVGEAVFIFVFGKDKTLVDRMYIGPIISQPQQLDFDPLYTSALAAFTFSNETPAKSTNDIPQLKGIFPNPQDVSIQGRYNTDITQKRNEIVIRAGKFETYTPDNVNPFNFAFNSNTQGFIQIKNNVPITDKEAKSTSLGTVTNIMSNKINLLTHKGGSPRFNLNQDNLISDEEMARILDEAHQLPFGDVLLEYLILMKNALFFHVHNGNGNPSSGVPLVQFREKAEALEKVMLSKNIRIN